MKDRMTLGHNADVAATAALTLADERADHRIVEELDREHDEKALEQTISDALGKLNKADREFVKAVFKRRSWKEMGISKQLFSWRLKKVEKIFEARK